MLWTWRQGLELCRAVEAKLAPLGAHVALGGGCMVKGWSEKDLDIFVYPHLLTSSKERIDRYVVALREMGFTNFQNRGWSHTNTTGDRKDVRSAVYKGKRVDIFFLEFTK